MPAKIYNFGNESDLGSSTLLAEVVKTTTEELTYYVSSTGNDASDGLTPATALLTIQAAIDKVPKFIEKYNVTINIGAGTFAGFYLFGFSVRRGTIFTIQGTLGTPTLTTGNTSGTSTGGSTTQLIDAGQNWTINELRGRLLSINGEYRVVRNNTANTINLIGASSATCSGKVYSLLEQKTVINSPNPILVVRGNDETPIVPTPFIYCNGNQASRDNFILSDLRIVGGRFGLYNHASTGQYWRRLYSTGATGSPSACAAHQSIYGESIIEDCFFSEGTYAGLVAVECSNQVRMWRVYCYHNYMGFFLGGPGSFTNVCRYLYADNNTSTAEGGFYVCNVAEAIFTNIFAENNAGAGLATSEACHFIYLDSPTISSNGINGISASNVIDIYGGIISGNTGYGIAMGVRGADGELSYGVISVQSATVISGNTLGGVYLGQKSIAIIPNTSGSNTGFGITLTENSFARIASTTTLTGISGDATIDAGTTVLTWATDFVNNGDRVTNVANGCCIERKD